MEQLRRVAYGELAGSRGAHLCQVILHDITDDAKLIKVPSAALCAKGLLEADLHVGDEVSVPRGRQELIGKSACSMAEIIL